MLDKICRFLRTCAGIVAIPFVVTFLVTREIAEILLDSVFTLVCLACDLVIFVIDTFDEARKMVFKEKTDTGKS